MPTDLESEQAAIACMLTDPQCVNIGVEVLQESDFERRIHQDIFAAIKRIAVKKDVRVDRITLKKAMVESGDWETQGCDVMEYVKNICGPEKEHFSPNMPHYCERLLFEAKRRAVITAANTVSAYAQNDKCDDPVAEYMRLGMTLGETRTADVADIAAVTHKVYQRMVDHLQGKAETGRMWYGIHDLDRLSRGISPGYEYTIIGARPSNGKTALANQVAMSAIKQDRKVLYFSLETGKEGIVQRLIFSQMKLNSAKFWAREYGNGDEIHSKLANATNEVFNTNGKLLLTDVNVGLASMQAKIMRLSHRHKDTSSPLGLVVVDYIQRVKTDLKSKSANESLEIISSGLADTCKTLNIPLVALAQINRQGADSPQLKDIRDGGNIEADADKVLLLDNKPPVAADASDAPRDCEIIVAKNRDGRTGAAKCAFHGGFLCFTSRNIDEWSYLYDD